MSEIVVSLHLPLLSGIRRRHLQLCILHVRILPARGDLEASEDTPARLQYNAPMNRVPRQPVARVAIHRDDALHSSHHVCTLHVRYVSEIAIVRDTN